MLNFLKNKIMNFLDKIKRKKTRIEVPKENLTDKAISLSQKTIETLIPGGPIGTEIVSWIIKKPYDKRIEKWQIEMTEAVNALIKKQFDINQLQNDDEFIDFLLQASYVAMRNSQAEKRRALKNAIINFPESSNHARQFIFLNYIDVLTDVHINILTFMDNPNENKEYDKYQNLGIANIEHLIFEKFPNLNNDKNFISLIWKDLYNKGLIGCDESTLKVTMSGAGVLTSRTTDIGHEFIVFIKN